jgi:hypothetical protein
MLLTSRHIIIKIISLHHPRASGAGPVSEIKHLTPLDFTALHILSLAAVLVSLPHRLRE